MWRVDPGKLQVVATMAKVISRARGLPSNGRELWAPGAIVILAPMFFGGGPDQSAAIKLLI